MSNRDFSWLSSTDKKNKEQLTEFNERLSCFYSELSSRLKYNKLIEGVAIDEELDDVSKSLISWINENDFRDILEVGCGTGRIRKHLLLEKGEKYTGIEVSEDIINNNRIEWPMSDWFKQGIYDLSFKPQSFDLVFSVYVLEHLVFPHDALEKMYEVTKQGGSMVIIFPDFVKYRILPSQFLGWSFLQSAKEKLKKGKVIDAMLSVYDSKVRLSNAMADLEKTPGRFMINTSPICMDLPENEDVWSDFDAVYIASRAEVENWALSKNMSINYPGGKDGIFDGHVFIELTK